MNSTAPFADAVNNMFGGGVGGGIMAGCAIVSGIGALNGWTMLVAEMPAGADAVFVGFLMFLVGIPVYLWLKAGRGEYGPPAKSPAKTSE